jgi:hypothetical protein
MEMARRTVALVDWHWKGHHPTYFVQFVRALLELGVTVLALCPAPEAVLAATADLPEEWRGRLKVEGLGGWVGAPRFTPGRLREPVAAARNFLRIRRAISELEKRTGRLADLVFFACIYDWDFFHLRWHEWAMPRRWAGLHLQSFAFRETTDGIYGWHRRWADAGRILRGERMVGVATLDEGIRERVTAVTGRECVVFPDTTDERLPEEGWDTELLRRIRAMSVGRPLVSLCGMLYPQRGVEAFLRLAMERRDWAFLLVGQIPAHSWTGGMEGMLERFLRDHPHAHFHPMRVADGPEYNALFRVSDLVWNVHVDWPGSSNTLTKAAVCQRPVLVADGHLLAERVREYRLGEICDHRSVESIGAAAERILMDPAGWRERMKPRWEEYRERHSSGRLVGAMREVLGVLEK